MISFSDRFKVDGNGSYGGPFCGILYSAFQHIGGGARGRGHRSSEQRSERVRPNIVLEIGP